MPTRVVHHREEAGGPDALAAVTAGRTAAARPQPETRPVNPAPFDQNDAADAGIGAVPGVASGALAGALLAWADAAGALVAVKDIATGRYLWVDARMARFLGRAAGQVAGHTDGDLFDADAAASLRAADQFAVASGWPTRSEHRLHTDGRRREFDVLRAPLAAADGGEPRLLCSVWTETTAEREREARLKSALAQIEAQQASPVPRPDASQAPGWRDAVTGLHHGAHFDDQLRREVDLSSREHREFALVAVTLDAPTDAARTLGGEDRTAVLEAFGRLVTGNTRAMDSSCRLAEDRFAILLSGVGLATAHARMEGLRRQCATQIVMHAGQPLGFTLSVGVASFPHTAQTQQTLSDAADAAMREALRRGGNQVALASIRFEPA